MANKFDKVEFDAKEKAKKDAKANVKADTLAGLKVRVAFLEAKEGY